MCPFTTTTKPHDGTTKHPRRPPHHLTLYTPTLLYPISVPARLHFSIHHYSHHYSHPHSLTISPPHLTSLSHNITAPHPRSTHFLTISLHPIPRSTHSLTISHLIPSHPRSHHFLTISLRPPPKHTPPTHTLPTHFALHTFNYTNSGIHPTSLTHIRLRQLLLLILTMCSSYLISASNLSTLSHL